MRSITVNTPYAGVTLPNGLTYDASADSVNVTLSDAEFNRIGAHLFAGGDPILTDNGPIGLQPNEFPNAIDSTTGSYHDTYRDQDIQTLVLPSDGAWAAIAIEGDAFPRLVMNVDGIYLGDGTVDPLVGDGETFATYGVAYNTVQRGVIISGAPTEGQSIIRADANGVSMFGPVVNISGNTVQTTVDGALGFFGFDPVQQPEVTGAQDNGEALTSLLAALVALGLITDSSTPPG